VRLSFGGTVRTLVGIAVVALGAAYLAQHGTGELWESSEEYSAKERVRRVLEGVRTGAARQEAVCLWSTGSLIMPDGPFDVAEDAFDAWAREKEIVTVTEYEILGARRVETARPQTPGTGTVIVRARINGTEHEVLAKRGQRLTWIR
jgi:hypothetical protein